LYAHMNNKRKMKKKECALRVEYTLSSFLCILVYLHTRINYTLTECKLSVPKVFLLAFLVIKPAFP
jgi:hypothetical protein